MKLRAIAAVLAMMMTAPGCGGAPGEPDQPGIASVSIPGESASIIGSVTQVERAGGRVRILVEQVPTRSAGYPIAWISVGSSTHIVARSGGQASRASAGELAEGTRVQVWFTGPVAESWPVQATAGTVLIER